MCFGGGPSGPSAAELAAQERESRSRAQAETDRINAERTAAKEAENAKLLEDQASQAKADQARRQKNRTLLAGLVAEEGTGDPTDPLSVPQVPDASATTLPPITDAAPEPPKAGRKNKNAKSLIGAY